MHGHSAAWLEISLSVPTAVHKSHKFYKSSVNGHFYFSPTDFERSFCRLIRNIVIIKYRAQFYKS